MHFAQGGTRVSRQSKVDRAKSRAGLGLIPFGVAIEGDLPFCRQIVAKFELGPLPGRLELLAGVRFELPPAVDVVVLAPATGDTV